MKGSLEKTTYMNLDRHKSQGEMDFAFVTIVKYNIHCMQS